MHPRLIGFTRRKAFSACIGVPENIAGKARLASGFTFARQNVHQLANDAQHDFVGTAADGR